MSGPLPAVSGTTMLIVRSDNFCAPTFGMAASNAAPASAPGELHRDRLLTDDFQKSAP
jgi:hypothetical protein